MIEEIRAIAQRAAEAMENAGLTREIEELRVKYLGKKGELTAVLKDMGRLSPEERPIIGAAANEARERISALIETVKSKLAERELAASLESETLDVTLPARRVRRGHRHPMSKVRDEVTELFLGMGFTVAEGPEVELTRYCFDALNTGPDHPARDRRDTFYITDDVILRTQTSSVQIREMERTKPPVRIISPGRVYRKDEIDATHSPLFHQTEGLVVDKGVTFADLKGTLETLCRGIYGEEAKLRFRPHHFPYTEPSAEVDLRCFNCSGAGCSICKGEGWIELLGSGMVHPKVLETCGIDPEVYSGFAFGVGMERLTLGRFAISDMRLLFENDTRFLSQF